MPRYQKGTAGKLIVQDWQVLETYDDVNVLRYVTPRQAAALIALAEFLAWSTRYINPPGQDALDAFEAETRYNLMTPVDFCALMINCIVNDTDVQDALTAWLIQSIQNNIDVQNALNEVYKETDHNVPIPPGSAGENLLPANPGCDLDMLFGQIVSLIENMNTNNLDAFEVTETATNIAERVVLLMGAIPVLETLPVDEVLDYAQQIWTDDLFEAYVANDTTGYRDELKCDLFCIAQANGCQLSMDNVRDYFAGRVGASPEDAIAEAIAYVLAGTWTGTEVNDLFYWAQVSLMMFGNKYFNLVGLKPYAVYLKLGDPDSDWSTLCETCPEDVCVTYNFANPIPDFTLESGSDASLDASGYYLSGAWTGGGGNPQWIIGSATHTWAEVNRITIVTEGFQKNPVEYNISIGLDLTFYVASDMEVIEDGTFVTFILDVEPVTIDTLYINLNQPVNPAFKLLSVEICYVE